MGQRSTTARTYDTDGRLTGISSAGTTSYEYFLDGQIKSTTDDVEFSPALTEGSTLFTVDSTSNRVQSASGLETRSYTYDAAGNTLLDGTRTYTYNDSGRMATAAHQGVTTSYVYNALGERVKKSNASVTRYFAYDEAGHLLGEYDSQGDLIQETVWLGDIPVATLRSDGSGGIEIFYVHTDHLNTPRRVTRPADDVVVWRWQSAPFGATEADQDPDGDQTVFRYNLRFPGQYRDEETGLYYNYFRTYDPGTGRYQESDPIGLRGGLNSYAYTNNNPIGYLDPKGLAEFPPSLPLTTPDYYSLYGLRGDYYEITGNHRPPAGPGLVITRRSTVCVGLLCAFKDDNRSAGHRELPLLPEYGAAFSLCFSPKQEEPRTCAAPTETSEFNDWDWSLGLGRYFGMTSAGLGKEVCLNVGLGIGPPVNSAKDIGPFE